MTSRSDSAHGTGAGPPPLPPGRCAPRPPRCTYLPERHRPAPVWGIWLRHHSGARPRYRPSRTVRRYRRATNRADPPGVRRCPRCHEHPKDSPFSVGAHPAVASMGLAPWFGSNAFPLLGMAPATSSVRPCLDLRRRSAGRGSPSGSTPPTSMSRKTRNAGPSPMVSSACHPHRRTDRAVHPKPWNGLWPYRSVSDEGSGVAVRAFHRL